MIGTIVNVAGIAAGGVAGMAGKKSFSPATQFYFKMFLGLATVCSGLYLTWISVNGPFLQILKQLVIVVVSLMLGKLTGRLLQLQKSSNRLGQLARDRMGAARPGNPNRFNDGFVVCATLFCAAPLGILGAIHDGLSGYFYPLAVKAVMDGLAAMSFVSIFGGGVVLSGVPVLIFQSTITWLCSRFLLPFLSAHGLVDPVNATGGLLIFCVGLLIFEIKKIEVTDYLPALIFAPLLAYFLS